MRLQLEQGCLRRRLEGIEPGNGKGGGWSRDRSRSRVGRRVAGWTRGRGLGRGIAGWVAIRNGLIIVRAYMRVPR